MLNTKNDIIGTTEDERLVRMREVKRLTGLGASTIYRLIKAGRFPAQIYPLGNHICAWRLSDVRSWVNDRAAGKAA